MSHKRQCESMGHTRHCERSAAIYQVERVDCFVATLLAMTDG